ncbi:hypothetical protein TNCV_4188781 [Trichonephila clavipes]|nr:hypothetical protein TNCV_4188781 [Trichonephila clavipes]
MHHLLENFPARFDDVNQKLNHLFYVDNCLTGVTDIAVEEHFIDKAIETLTEDKESLEVGCSLRNPKVAGSIPVGDDRFFGCENRRYACRMNMWHVKDPRSNNLVLILSEKLNCGNI